MRHFIEVIVSPCRRSGDTWVICGSRVHESKHSVPLEALKTAMSLRGADFSIIIRPSFVEMVNGVEGFREWRSFNGSTFREILWPCGGTGQTVSTEREDHEVILPGVHHGVNHG